MPVEKAGILKTSTAPARVLPDPTPPTNNRNREGEVQNAICGFVLVLCFILSLVDELLGLRLTCGDTTYFNLVISVCNRRLNSFVRFAIRIGK